jgi:hypothetical protein
VSPPPLTAIVRQRPADSWLAEGASSWFDVHCSTYAQAHAICITHHRYRDRHRHDDCSNWNMDFKIQADQVLSCSSMCSSQANMHALQGEEDRSLTKILFFFVDVSCCFRSVVSSSAVRCSVLFMCRRLVNGDLWWRSSRSVHIYIYIGQASIYYSAFNSLRNGRSK